GATEFVLEGLSGRPNSMALAGNLLGVTSGDRLALVPLANPGHTIWEQTEWLTVRSALGGRAIVLGPGSDAMAIGVMGERHEQLGGLNATADAFRFSPPPASAGEEIPGLAAAWEAVFGVFGDDPSAAERRRRREAGDVERDRLVAQARARG